MVFLNSHFNFLQALMADVCVWGGGGEGLTMVQYEPALVTRYTAKNFELAV